MAYNSIFSTKKITIFFILLLLNTNLFAQQDTLEVKRLDSLEFEIEEEVISNEILVKNIIDNYKESLGGDKKLKKFKNITIKQTVSVGDVIYNIVKYYEYPNKMTKVLSSMGDRIEKIVYDGNKARRWGVKGYKIIKDEELEKLKHEATIFLPLFLDKYKFTLTFDTIEYVDGLEAKKVTATSSNGEQYIFHFDALNGHVLKWSLIEKDYQDKEVIISIDYDEFREVDGYEFPHEIIYTRKDLQLTYRVSLITINSKLDKNIFTFKE